MLRCGNVRRLSAKRVAVADDREKSDSAKVAGETDEQSGPNRSGAGGAKGGAGGGRETAKHGLGTEPGNHVTCAGARTGCRNINVLPVTPKVGACAGILPDTDLGGGAVSNDRPYRITF